MKTGTLSLNEVGDKFFFKGDDEISRIISIQKKKGNKTTTKKLKANNYYNFKLINWLSSHCLFLLGNSLKTLKGFLKMWYDKNLDKYNKSTEPFLFDLQQFQALRL